MRLWFIFLLVIILLLLMPGCEKYTPRHPNVVFILIDTLRADHLPFYGYEKDTTPFLSTLAAKGVVFEKVYSTSSWTAPATASIFTSLYPFQHGVFMNILATIRLRKENLGQKVRLNKIPEEITTLGEIFKSVGYSTYLVSDNINIGDKEGFTQGFDRAKTFNYENARFINQRIIEWAEEIKKQEKYFLYIHYMDPHQPIHKRLPWYQEMETKEANTLSMYDSEISFVDKKIEELCELFGWADDTLIIVTSDHGEEFWEHGETGHGYSLYREVIHVPLLIFYPQGGFRPKRIVSNVSVIDVLPTIRDILGLSPDKENEGISLLPVIKGEVESLPDRYLFSHLLKKRFKTRSLLIESVVHDNWHYIETYGRNAELYNLKLDPQERHNQASSRTQKIIEGFSARYHLFESRCRKYKWVSDDYTIDKKQLEKLKTLGYVQ